MRISDLIPKSILILLGIAAFIYKSQYQGPYQELVISYGGNFSISFVLYLLFSIYASSSSINKFFVFVITLTIVELYEVTNGYGIIPHVYDARDLLANLVGVFLAAMADLLIKKLAT